MIVERAAAAIALACVAAYFAERLGLVDLPGIPTDYMALSWVALAVAVLVRRAREGKGVGAAHG